MILTEEQREAIRAVSDLPRAIGCTRCHNYIQKNYSNQFAVLRSMIDNKDYVPNAAKLIELLAAGEHEQWADWAQSILDSEPGLSEGRKAAWPGMIATPYENLSEELKDKDRREVHLRSSVALDIVQQQAAEIERLRASLIDLHAEYINTLEKNPDCSAWDLDEQSDADQRRLRKNAAHAISITEPPIYLQAEQLAARIKELEDAHKRSGAKYAKIINELRSSVYANIPGLDVDKIGPDAAKPREGLFGKYIIRKSDGHPVDPEADYFVMRLDTDPVARRAAREYSYVTPDRNLARGLQDRLARYDPQLKDCMNIQFFGLAKPHCWQITAERIGLLEYCLETLLDAPDIEEIPGPGHSIEMLRAMLREAEQ